MIKKKKFKILTIILLVICISMPKYSLADNNPNEITPQENQYMELRATTINTVEGKDKQVIFELWSYNIEFAGFDVRFSYDGTKFATSDLLNNDYTDDESKYFAFESRFTNKLELFTVESKANEIRAVLSFNPPVSQGDEIKNENGNITIDTTGGVLLGKMSFRLKGEMDISSFKLKESETSSPKTGIKINIDGIHNYQAQSTFRFTDKTASKDAYLSDLIVSSGIKDEETPENSTYKEYELVPTFDKETLKYELTLMEYIDTINIKLTQNDPKSTIKMKVPKRDENSKLQYEEDGQTIIYEEKQIQIDTQQEVVLNKLGEPDTIITITVTAEDGKTINNYELTIKRPYGTIKGSIQLGENLRESMDSTYGIFLEYIANVTLYDSQEFEWKDVIDLTVPLSDLSKHKKLDEIQTEGKDGKFEMKIIPGNYDLYLNEEGFVPIVINDIELKQGDNFDIGNKLLYEGDANCNGIIDLNDLVDIIYRKDKVEGDPEYRKSCDFGRKGYISLIDMISEIANKDKYITIEEFSNY